MLKKLFFSFFASLLIISILFIITQILLQYFDIKIISRFYYFLILYFVVISSYTHYILLKALIFKPNRFLIKFMLTTTIKLFLSIIILIIFIFTNKLEAKIFSLNFVVLYLIYLFFDIFMILKQSKIVKSNTQ